MAEALGRLLAADVFESCSAGTEIAAEVNPDAVRVMRRLYGVELLPAQRPKPLAALPPVDVVVTMGCGVQCPSLPCRLREDWDWRTRPAGATPPLSRRRAPSRRACAICVGVWRRTTERGHKAGSPIAAAAAAQGCPHPAGLPPA